MRRAILIAVLAGGAGAVGVILVQQGLRFLGPAPATQPAGASSAPAPTQPPVAPGGTVAATLPGGGVSPLPASTEPPAIPIVEAPVQDANLAVAEANQAVVGAHEKAAGLAVAEVRYLIASRQYDKAAALARSSIPDYSDTSAGKELPDLVAAAESGLADQKADRSNQEAKAQHHQRFLQYRSEGLGAVEANNLPAAIQSYQIALAEEEDPDTRVELEDLIDRTTKPRVGVADFAVAGDVGYADPGKTTAELLLSQLSTEKFQLVERTRVAALMLEKDMAIAEIVDNPALLRGKGIRGVKFMVLGTVSRTGKVVITARLVNVATGDILQTAEVQADTPDALQDAMRVLAAILQMTAQEKEAYLAAQAEEARDRDQRLGEERRSRRESAELMAAHNRQALVALDQINDLLRRRYYDAALDLAVRGSLDFADTQYAENFNGQGRDIARQIEELRRAERIEREKWRRHCGEAMLLLGQAKTLMDRRDYGKAIEVCQAAARDYGDTPVAMEYRRILKDAQQEQAALQAARDEGARKHLREGQDCLRRMLSLMGAGEYGQVVVLGQKAAADFADTPSAGRIADVLAGARQKLVADQADRDRRLRHEQDAAAALANLRALLTRKDLARVVQIGEPAVRSYSDTAAGKDIADALAAAKAGLAAARPKEDADKVRRLKHEEDAAAALAALRALLADRKYDPAVAQAQQAVKDFADTTQGKALSDTLAEAQRKAGAERETGLAGKRLHEQDAKNALAEIKALLDKKDYDKAVAQAQSAAKEYADTTLAKDLSDVRAAAQRARDAAASSPADATAKARAEAAAKMKHENDANTALTSIRALLARKDFDAAVAAATDATKAFADTSRAKALSDALAEAKRDHDGAAKAQADATARAQADATAKLKHEQDANAALVTIRGLIAKKDYDAAVAAATAASKAFSDTSHAKALSEALAEARKEQDASLKAEADATAKARADAAARLKHESDANTALISIRSLMMKKDYGTAVASAEAAVKAFADTSYAKALSDALANAKRDQDAAMKAQADATATARADADSKLKHEQFLEFRQEGAAAMRRRDYPAAVTAFENALKVEDDAATRQQLEGAKGLAKPLTSTPLPVPGPASRPGVPPSKIDAARATIAVAEFRLARGAGRPLVAAKDIDDALLKKFPADKYQAINSAALGDILAKAGLDANRVAAQPSVLAGKKVQGLEYLVVGTVGTDAQGRTVLDAELIDAATGRAVQSAKATLRAATDLDSAFADLAKALAK